MSDHESRGPRAWNRDAALERAWRETSAEQPPSHVDAAIIAAAHESVMDRGAKSNTAPVRMRARTWLTQWQPLAAAAVVATLAFGIVQMLPRELDLAPSMQWKESASPTAPVPAAADTPRHGQTQPQPQPQPQLRPQPLPQPPPRSSPAREAANSRQPAGTQQAVGVHDRIGPPDRAPSAVPAAPTIPAPPPPTAGTTTSDASSKVEATVLDAAPRAETTAATADTAPAFDDTRSDRQGAARSDAAGRAANTAAAPSARANEGTLSNATPLDSQAWAAKVAALHASGDVTAAEHELREFRMFVPDADLYLPDSLRSWARTVK